MMERLMGVRLGTTFQDAGQSSLPITHSEEKLLSQSQKMPCLRGRRFKLIFCLVVIKGLLTQWTDCLFGVDQYKFYTEKPVLLWLDFEIKDPIATVCFCGWNGTATMGFSTLQLPRHLWEEPVRIVSAHFIEVDSNAILPPAFPKAEKSHFLSLLSYVACPRLLIILVASAGLIHVFLLGSAAMDTALRVLPLPC